MDRVGTRRGLTLSVIWYSTAAMLTSLATGLRSFCVFRFLLGIGESANWPAATKAVSEWFPSRERALAVALFDSGSGLGAIDLSGTGEAPYNITWWENPRDQGGNARTGTWTPHYIGPAYDTVHSGFGVSYGTLDVNGDGRQDVITSEGETDGTYARPPGGMIWWEAPIDRRNGTCQDASHFSPRTRPTAHLILASQHFPIFHHRQLPTSSPVESRPPRPRTRHIARP
jgi:hypothetical protein